MLDEKYLLQIEEKARAKSPQQYQVPVANKQQGLVLLGALETHLTTKGFEFTDIPGDKNNNSCIKSRNGLLRLYRNKGVHFVMRLFNRADGTVSFFIHVQ